MIKQLKPIDLFIEADRDNALLIVDYVDGEVRRVVTMERDALNPNISIGQASDRFLAPALTALRERQ